MSKIDLVRKEMMNAMKAGDKPRKEALSLLLSALKNKQIDKRADLTEDEENAIIFKEIKEAKETMETSPADRSDIIEECRTRINVYSEFAPQLMGEDETGRHRAGVKRPVPRKPQPQDKGRIMKELMPKVKGKADGKLVNSLVTELFQ